jgi:hypothetical protein
MKKDNIEVFNMRTINEKMSKRIKIQAQEAELIGLKKVAGHLNQLAETKTRENDASYVYKRSDLANDVEAKLWQAALRVADYYDCSIAAEFVQDNIERFAEELVSVIGKQARISHGVGAHEPAVPGEVIEEVLIEVE